MSVGGCGLVSKYIIIIFNCILAAVGTMFLGFGLWLRFSNGSRQIFQIQDLDSTTFVIAVIAMIVLGVVMLIVVSFGDHGAYSESRCSLQVFSCLVAILAGAETLIGILAYTYPDKVGSQIIEFYSSLYGLYVTTGDPVMTVALTFLHKMLHCCGLTGIPIVELVQMTCPDPKYFMEHIKMPDCPSTIASTFDPRAPLMMGVFVGTEALLITALVCSAILLTYLRSSEERINAYYSKVN